MIKKKKLMMLVPVVKVLKVLKLVIQKIDDGTRSCETKIEKGFNVDVAVVGKICDKFPIFE